MQILKQMVKRPENMKNTLKNLQNFIPRKLKKQNKILQKNQEGVKVEPASKLSLVSGNYLQPKVPDGVDLASAEAEIRHVFGDTPITEASIGAAPPGNNIAQWACAIGVRGEGGLGSKVAAVSQKY